MDIQDLGAIGEFVSSVVIVITLIVLVYEVRSTKRATQLANAQERRRDRTAQWRMVVDSPPLAAIIAKAYNHNGDPGILNNAREYGLEPQVVVMMPLLEGVDGVQKMSKSLNNHIGITAPPEEMYGRTMSISDELMWRYFELLSFRSLRYAIIRMAVS